MTDAKTSMVFAFTDGSASFVNGFEAGTIWQEIDGEGKSVIDRGFDEAFPVHTENMEVIQRMAAARGYRLETKETGIDGWTAIRLSFVGTAKPILKAVQ